MDLNMISPRSHFVRHKSDPLPKIVLNDAADAEIPDRIDEEISGTENTMNKTVPEAMSPEVTYGIMPRMSWMYRLMERAGAGAKSARALPWIESEKDSYQHHADYLRRLSKLREELIHQEQTNLANALDRLRMKSYGKEFAYSRPQKDRRFQAKQPQSQENQTSKRSLITTFEKFQRMRPKKTPPSIMPLEGKSLIDSPSMPVTHRDRSNSVDRATERGPARTVDESVRLNLQRLATNSVPSIPRQRRSTHRDIVLENSATWRRQQTIQDVANSSNSEDRISQMQRQKQKLMKLRHDAREAEKIKLAPQSFRLDTLNDEDRMNLEKLKDYYCIYYVPAPASSPVGDEMETPIHLPAINFCNNQEHAELHGSPLRGQKPMTHVNRTGFKITTDNPIPPTTCNGSCRMYISGNKVESSVDKFDYTINQTQSANCQNSNDSENINSADRKHLKSSEAKQNGRAPIVDYKQRESKPVDNNNNKTSSSPPVSQERMRIRVDMPSIVYNESSPEHTLSDSNTGLVKAFKQKELRQREFSNLMEDVRELNMRTETLASSIQ